LVQSDSHTSSPDKKLTIGQEFINSLLTVWAELGNQISRIYCGAGSVMNNLTNKENNAFFTFFSSGIRTINRYYQSNMNDGVKQECLNYFLGKKE
jgi:hypothetical protein